MPRFVSEAIEPDGGAFDPVTLSHGEPGLPPAFTWHGERLVVDRIARTWRSTKTDRGESYLKRHWFACRLQDGRDAVVYMDRAARRGAPRWWLYTIEVADAM